MRGDYYAGIHCTRHAAGKGPDRLWYKKVHRKRHNWQKKGVKHLSDIDKLDEDRRQQKAAKAENSAARPKPAPSKNKFNNFHQRTYNVDELEKQLLK